MSKEILFLCIWLINGVFAVLLSVLYMWFQKGELTVKDFIFYGVVLLTGMIGVGLIMYVLIDGLIEKYGDKVIIKRKK